MPNSIPMSLLYIITAYIRVSNCFSFLTNSLMLSMYIRWLIFSCDLVSLYPPGHFLSMWLSGIIAITNSNVESTFSWNIPLWIFTSARLFPPAINFTLQFSLVFFNKFFDFIRYLVHFETVYYPVLKDHIVSLFVARFWHLILLSLWMCWSIYSSSPVPLVPFLFIREQSTAY